MNDIITKDRHNIPYVYESTTNAICNVILVHGITVNKNEYNDVFVLAAKKLLFAKANTIRFDFRGHGESKMKEEEMTIRGESIDLGRILEFVSSKNKLPIFIIASSFGAVAALIISAQKKHKINGLVLWNPVLDTKRTFITPTTVWASTFFNKETLTNLRKQNYLLLEKYRVGRKLVKEMQKFNCEKLICDIETPICIFHGDKDEFVPYRITQEFCKKYFSIELITLKNAGHGFLEYQESVIKESINWILKQIHS